MSEKYTPIVEGIITQLKSDDEWAKIQACLAITSGGVWPTESENNAMVDELKRQGISEVIIYDLGYLGAYIVSSLLKLTPVDSCFDYVSSMVNNPLQLEVFYEGVTEYFQNCRFGDAKAERLMDLLLLRISKVSEEEQFLIVSSIELTTCELGISALRLVRKIPEVIPDLSAKCKGGLIQSIEYVTAKRNFEDLNRLKSSKK